MKRTDRVRMGRKKSKKKIMVVFLKINSKEAILLQIDRMTAMHPAVKITQAA